MYLLFITLKAQSMSPVFAQISTSFIAVLGSMFVEQLAAIFLIYLNDLFVTCNDFPAKLHET